MSINKVFLLGNLGQDPECRRLENGTAVCRFSLATSETYKDANGELKTETEWHNIILYRANAENAEKYLKKGSKVHVEGKIKYRKYTDKNGVEKSVTDINCIVFEMLDKKEGSGFSENNFPTTEPHQRQTQKEETPKGNDDNPFGESVPELFAPYSCNVCYKVKSGKLEGKEFEIKSIAEKEIIFKFITGEEMTFEKPTFDEFFKICELSELPF